MGEKSKKKIGALNYIIKLLSRYERGNANPTEQKALDNWRPDIGELANYPMDECKAEASRQEVSRQIAKYIDRDKNRATLRPSWTIWQRSIAAAVVILLVGSGSWMAWQRMGNPETKTTLMADVRRTWTTDDDHRLTLTLPDGSKVKVNADSRLEIAEAAFNKEKREVWLTGEAFFEVAKNPEKPFIIHTGAMQTTVRGTSFNVKAYAELGKNVVSVRDGKVEITEGERQLALLTANRQIKYSTENRQAEVSDADWRDAAGWTEGRLVLNGANAEELKLRLRQQFGVEVNIESGALDGTSVAGSFSKERTLQEVLHTIGTVYNIQYEITGTHVIIKPR